MGEVGGRRVGRAEGCGRAAGGLRADSLCVGLCVGLCVEAVSGGCEWGGDVRSGDVLWALVTALACRALGSGVVGLLSGVGVCFQ